MYFLGIDNIKNGYRCYDPKNKRFYVFDDVKFDENSNFEDLGCTMKIHEPEEKHTEEVQNKEKEDPSINNRAIFETCRSQQVRKPMDRITYHSLFVEHCLFM